jgi:collagenase-like PrtC family protease
LESWQLYSGEAKWEEQVALKNDAFFLVGDIPHLIDLGVHCLKIQGREYPVPLVGVMVRYYRELIDAYLTHPKGRPFDIVPWRARLAGIEADRNAARSEGTRLLLIEARQPVSTA